MSNAMQVFEIPGPSSNSGVVLLLLLPLILVVIMAAVFWPRALRVEVSSDALAIRGTVYGRSVPRSRLRADEARIIDLAEEQDLSPRIRTNGVSLPNYRVGWFRLRDNERALCFLTRTDSVLYLPTTEGYALLISTSTPTQLLNALQNPG
jgi:Bacterial PH domain